jgi:2-dehydro-3-deoxy-D-arabinonate dehydratase
MPSPENIGIHLSVHRQGQVVFQDSIGVSQMARSFENLLGWLARDNSFPQGVFLLTGTGIVPDSQFSLRPGDQIDISIDGIGKLSCPVIQGDGDDRARRTH